MITIVEPRGPHIVRLRDDQYYGQRLSGGEESVVGESSGAEAGDPAGIETGNPAGK